MSIKLGTTTASLYLGTTPVAAYLGAAQVYSAVAARTLYFDGFVNSAWTTLGNWWNDAEHTDPATSLPTAADSVVVTASITASGQTVANFTLNDDGESLVLSGTLAVTGNATFNGISYNAGTVTGNATFNDGSGNAGTVTGNATFNDASYNLGTVTGNATFNDSSGNGDEPLLSGTVTGDATFNGNSYNSGSVNGTATFTGSACNDGGTAGTFVPETPPEC